MKISYTIDIDNTPEKVFHWLNNPERAMVWMSSVSKTELLSKTSDMVGTTFREIVEEGGRGTELHGVVTAYRPNQLIAFHLRGEFNVVEVEFRLEEIEGRTRLTQNSKIRFKSFIKIVSLLLGPMIKKKILAQLKREFAELKKLCEQDASC